ncbi:MAG: hypothetical protein ACRENX_05335 [Candidatus Dormibacteria bacterium]
MDSAHVQLRRTEHATEVFVTAWPGPSSPYRVESSNKATIPADAEWPAHLRGLIGTRSGHGGTEKGRILYCVQSEGPLIESATVGALAYHLDRTRVLLTALGTVRFKHGTDIHLIHALLLACALEVARCLGSDCLYWVVHQEAAALQARQDFGFRRLARDHPVQRRNRRAIVLQLQS